MSKAMKDSGIPWMEEIPIDWNIRQFRRLFRIHKDIANALGYDVLSVTQRGIIIKDLTTNEGQIAQDYSKYQLVSPDDFVMNHMDLLTGYIDISKYKGVTSPDYRVFNAIDEKAIQIRYYLYIFQLCYKCQIFYTLGQGVSGLGRWRLPAEQQKLFYLPLPPLPEQKAIADYLDKKCAEIDELISLQEKIIDELTAYKQSIITEAITKGLNPNVPMKDSGVEWIGMIPEEWKVKKLKYSCDMYGRIGFRGYTADDLVEEGEGAITLSPTNMNKICVDFSKCSYLSWDKYYESPEIMVENGDVLLVKTASVGKCSYVENLPMETTVNPQILVLKKHKDNPKFITYIFQTPIGQSYIDVTKGGSTIFTISQEKIGNYMFAFPKIEEQHNIVAFLDAKCSEIDKMISIKQSKIEELKDYKKSIIYECVTGKKDVI